MSTSANDPAAAAPVTGPDRIRVAVMFGGRSTEHAISCVSAGHVLRALDRNRYDVIAIGITPAGRWVVEADDPERFTLSADGLPAVDAGAAHVRFAPDPTDRALWLAGSGGLARELADVDVVFPVLHGPWGEDGTIQGLFEMAGLPYVGSGVLASAVGMDKGHMKALLLAAGLPVGTYEVLTDRAWRTDREDALARIRLLAQRSPGAPLFVKPARAGSSVGISRIAAVDLDGPLLVGAIEQARQHDPRLVIELGFDGVREIECGVLAGVDGGPPVASLCGEIIVRGPHLFYDFEAKYLDDSADLIVPAELPAGVSDRVRQLALDAFAALGCEGLARVDFFVHPDGSVVINEVNTMPGFTRISMYPRMWAATGIDGPALVDRLVQDALLRGTGLR